MHGARAPGLIFFLLFLNGNGGWRGEEVGGGGEEVGGGGRTGGRRGEEGKGWGTLTGLPHQKLK